MSYYTKVYEGKRARVVDLFSQKHMNFQVITFSPILRSDLKEKKVVMCRQHPKILCIYQSA